MKRHIYFIRSLIFAVLVLLGNISIAQNLTKIKDATVSGTSVVAAPGAILELESINKGFLVPRMTTGQRDAILGANRTDGLLIYNITTGCFNHWSAAQSVWLSICGTPPPATITISATQCSAITVNGVYTEGSLLTTANFLSIPVTVTQAGSYSVSATTTNGYYFEKTGNFPSAGNYTLNLAGTGTPNSATPNLGDAVSISINGAAPISCVPYVPIVAAAVNYNMDCNSIAIAGGYHIGIPLALANKITLSVTPVTAGFWSISTNTANGMKFSGTGTFTSASIGSAQTIELLGSGTPLASGTNSFTINSNSVSSSSCTGVNVAVSTVSYTMDCATATVNGNYMQDVALTAANTITLPINVTATGTTTITTNTTNGITFTSGQINLTALGNQNVTLTASGTPTGAGAASFTITGTPGAVATCSISINISPQPVTYSINCGTVVANGSYRPNIALTATNTITMTVSATYGGSYSISTNAVAGISFSGSGTLAVGSNTITLQGVGTPSSAGEKSLVISTNSSNNSTCNTSLTVLYRPMIVLGVGGGTYQPASASDNETSKAVLMSAANFGTLPTSKVKVPKFTVGTTTSATNSALINGATPNSLQLTDFIDNKKIDIIVIGYSWAPNAAERAILIDFIKNKKGVVLNFSENSSASLDLAKELYNISAIVRTTANSGGATYLMRDIPGDPIMEGPFGKVGGQLWGEDYSATDHLGNLPSSVIVYSNGNGATTGSNTSLVTMFRDNTLGYLWNGDGGFLSGDRTNGGEYLWPAKNDASSNPIPKSPYGVAAYGGTGKSVYNSVFYANALAWAIQYVQQNKP